MKPDPASLLAPPAQLAKAALRHVLAGLLHQAADFQLNQGLRQFQRGDVEQRLHHAFLDTRLQTALGFAGDVLADFVTHLGHVAVGHAQVLGKIGVHFRKLRLGDVFQGDGEHGLFAGHIFDFCIPANMTGKMECNHFFNFTVKNLFTLNSGLSYISPVL